MSGADATREGPDGMGEIRIIALDLDGTLLDSDKNLPAANRAALERAAAAGIHVVPTTGGGSSA